MMDILIRLREYNPPDRTIDEQRQIAVDIRDAADEIEKLRRQLKEPRGDGVGIGESPYAGARRATL